MKTEKTKTAYTVSHGGKSQSCTCNYCRCHMRGCVAVFRIRGEVLGHYCSPQCIDNEIERRNVN